jgi:hypothetical protein
MWIIDSLTPKSELVAKRRETVEATIRLIAMA